MDENRIQDYLNLIQQLLNCPSGTEPAILQANSELLDMGFVQVCEGVAVQLAGSDNENAANFLRIPYPLSLIPYPHPNRQCDRSLLVHLAGAIAHKILA